MKRDPAIRDAIDKSLYGVRFNQNDMRSVLRAVRRDEERVELAPRRRKARGRRLELAFCTLLAVAVIAPMSFLALRLSGTANVDIVTSQGHVKPDATTARALATPDASGCIAESEAIAIARERFEALCDTSIFTFEEYAVSALLTLDSTPTYTITMESIYGNGCAFTVTIDATTGEVLACSSPSAAVIPGALDRSNAQISSWYDKYGACRFTWPLEQQAEFSRRYEGYLVRTPREAADSEDGEAAGVEMTAEQAVDAAKDALSSSVSLGISDAQQAEGMAYYAVLRSERAYADHVARYEVYAFDQPVTDSLPESGYLITLRADIESGATPSVMRLSGDDIASRENALYQ